MRSGSITGRHRVGTVVPGPRRALARTFDGRDMLRNSPPSLALTASESCMAKCAFCGTTILFGGKKVEGLTFCNNKCLVNGRLAFVAREIPNDVVASQARAVHGGPCPVCGEHRGPVDVHTSHKVASFLIMTSWSSTPRVSCRSCGTRAQIGALFYSLALGWWGIPWGILMTPVQVVKNLTALLHSEQSLTPSDQLEQLIRISMASQGLEASQHASY